MATYNNLIWNNFCEGTCHFLGLKRGMNLNVGHWSGQPVSRFLFSGFCSYFILARHPLKRGKFGNDDNDYNDVFIISIPHFCILQNENLSIFHFTPFYLFLLCLVSYLSVSFFLLYRTEEDFLSQYHFQWYLLPVLALAFLMGLLLIYYHHSDPSFLFFPCLMILLSNV